MVKDRFINIFSRLGFILLTTTCLVFFSEKTFWYIQGYAIIELILFYAVPVSICIWVIDYFQVQRLSGVVLVGALYGFLVEGVLTPVAYEGGLMDPFLPAYFVGWHGLLSFVFGWYLIRKWLREKNNYKLVLSSMLFGIFWGTWSLIYRLPESIQEFKGYIQTGEKWLPGAWSVEDFLFYTLVFTGLLMVSHWLLGRGIWQSEFKLTIWEIAILIGILVFIFVFTVIPVIPLGILKLVAMIALVILPLSINHLQRKETGLLTSLDGRIRFSQTFPLLLIPVGANLVYGLAALIPPPESWLRTLYESFSIIQALIGAGLFIWAWVESIRGEKINMPANQIHSS